MYKRQAWSGSLRVYVDAASNPVDGMQPADTLLRVIEQSSQVTTVSAPQRIALDANGRNLALAADGRLDTGAVQLCSSRVRRSLVVDRSGVVVMSRVAGSC